MEIFKEIAPLKAFLKSKKRQDSTVGFVPTMGALHEGHLSILRQAKVENDITVCSIYVNPTQFNNPNDLLKYPRTLDKDTESLRKVDCDVLFCPDNAEMYREASLLKFDFSHLDKVMEGKFRPGHFSGVALVVSKLFNIVQPDNAYFGQKDWQQYTIIRQLVEELQFDLTLHSVPTLRETDGLAMSSRNQRLNDTQRKQAIVFYNALTAAKTALLNGEQTGAVQTLVKGIVEQHPNVTLEYFEVAESKNLNTVENVKAADNPIMCIAGFVGEIRLIDNMFIR
jgi:pantoate--beta-alanine ligase